MATASVASAANFQNMAAGLVSTFDTDDVIVWTTGERLDPGTIFLLQAKSR
jgi:hypothetical protein